MSGALRAITGPAGPGDGHGPTGVAILLPEAMHPTTLDALQRRFTVHSLHHAHDRDELLDAVGGQVRAIARGNHAYIGADLMERLPNLEIVSVFGVGYDGIDMEHVRQRGLVVTNTPGVLDDEVADFTIALLIMTLRELPRAERYLRSGDWRRLGKLAPTPGSLRGRTVGVLGLGRIGRAVARRLEALGVGVAYHSRHRRPDVAYDYYPSALELAAAVDTLIAVLPGGPATARLVDAAVLAALGPSGVFVNVGRGSTVDEAALLDALEKRSILAAGLDVYQNEPDIDPRFMALDNAVLLPHVGSASQPTHDAMGRLLVSNLVSWFREGTPLTPVAETPWPAAGAVGR